MNRCHMDKRLNQLPTWLWSNSTTLPPIYKMVWESVREDRVCSNTQELLVDTNKVFPLLLTSQLPTEVLGHIWNLANQKYAGQLTEQELYIVLALVAAAQASYTFDSLDVLHLLPFPPTPYLNIECLLNLQPVHSTSAAKFQSYIGETESALIAADKYTEVKSKGRDSGIHSGTARGSVWESGALRDVNKSHSSLEVKQSSSEPSDDFAEFQSAPIPSLPGLSIWESKQGSAIGSRLANHNLGVRKPAEKSKKNNINVKSTQNSLQARAVPSSQHKDHNAECLTELFPKCTIKSQSKTVILKDTAIRNNDLPRSRVESLKEPNHVEKHTMNNKCNNNSFNNAESLESLAHQDLMNLQQVEDKYSALRALVQESSHDSSINTNSNQPIDEFGEFVSAEQPSNPPTSSSDHSLADIFSEFEFKASGRTKENSSESNCEVSRPLDSLKDEMEPLPGAGKAPPREDAISINSVELTNGASGALTRSGSVPSLDLKSFLPSNAEEEQPVETAQQAVYWEWKQYMESCVLLLQVAANIFTSISSESVLQEVLNSAQGYNFLCNLAEVAAVCRRVNFSYKEMDINIVGFDDLLMDIDRIWAEMEPFYANIPIVTELPAWPLHQGDSIHCSLCLTVITGGRLVYNEANYHATCANLWLNCVNNHLPVLRHPLYSHANPCPGNNHI